MQRDAMRCDGYNCNCTYEISTTSFMYRLYTLFLQTAEYMYISLWESSLLMMQS